MLGFVSYLQIEDSKILKVVCLLNSANCTYLRSPGTYKHFTTCRHKNQPERDLWVLVKLAGIVAEFLVEDKTLFLR